MLQTCVCVYVCMYALAKTRIIQNFSNCNISQKGALEHLWDQKNKRLDTPHTNRVHRGNRRSCVVRPSLFLITAVIQVPFIRGQELEKVDQVCVDLGLSDGQVH